MITDYHDFTVPSTPENIRRKLGVGDWYINACQCDLCHYICRSRNRHDMVSCRCGNISVDGGSWYLTRVGSGFGYRDISQMYDDVVKQ